jgi:hypothetical protein
MYTWEDISYCAKGRFYRGYLSCVLEDISIVLLEEIHLLVLNGSCVQEKEFLGRTGQHTAISIGAKPQQTDVIAYLKLSHISLPMFSFSPEVEEESVHSFQHT